MEIYIDIDRISAPLEDIHCITQVAWSHDEDMLFDTNCSSFLILTSSKSENPSLSEQRQRKIRKKQNIHYRDIYGCNIRLFSLQSNVHVCQYQISKWWILILNINVYTFSLVSIYTECVVATLNYIVLLTWNGTAFKENITAPSPTLELHPAGMPCTTCALS